MNISNKRLVIRACFLSGLALCALFYFASLRPKAVVLADFWSVAPYSEGKISGATLPMEISGQRGGVSLTTTKANTGMSKLSIQGLVESGAPTLRLRYGEEAPLYSPLLNSQQLWINPYSSFEVMLYADTPFKYRLEGISLERCAECLTPEAYKELIMSQVPGLRAALDTGEKLEAARLIMQWAAQVSDLAYPFDPASPAARIGAMSAMQIYQDIWEKDAGGGSCGAFAVFLARTLHEFGYTAFTVDTGFDASLNLTHVTTIVALPYGKKWKYYVFDPTYAGTFVDKNGDFMDIESLLALYRPNKSFDSPYWVCDTMLLRDRIINQDGRVVFVHKQYPNYPFGENFEHWVAPAIREKSPWGEKMLAYSSNPNINMLLDMFETKIFGHSFCSPAGECNGFAELFQLGRAP